MENIWRGAFAPTPRTEPVLSKSIGSATFVSICDMTEQDWKLLDWDNLSNTAKNAIVQLALKEPIVGFILFKFIKKGSAREGYFDPVGLSSLGSLQDALASPGFENYGNSDEALTPIASRVDKVVSRVSIASFGLSLTLLWPTVYVILNKVKENSADKALAKLIKCIESMFTDEANSIDELDATLAFVLTVLHYIDIEALDEWADEAEQILGDAEDKGLI